MDLQTTWFILLGVLLAGYAMLDGFDLGVGILHPMLRDEQQRNISVKAIGPLWDGNEVWLVTFGGALFAAFPEAYGTILSAFYIPVMLLLFFLILRAVSVDFRNKIESRRWKAMWDVGFFVSSLGATLVFGAAAGNLIAGISIDAAGEYSGSTADLFGAYPLAVALFAVLTFALHGISFLILKTRDKLRETLCHRIWHFWGVFLAGYVLVTMYTLIEYPHVVENIKRSYWPIPFVVVNVLAIANIPRSIYAAKFGQTFVSSAVNVVCLAALFYFSIFPELVIAHDPGNSISIYDAASSRGTLKIMLIIAAIGMPMVIAYTAVVYWTFRQPIEE